MVDTTIEDEIKRLEAKKRLSHDELWKLMSLRYILKVNRERNNG